MQQLHIRRVRQLCRLAHRELVAAAAQPEHVLEARRVARPGRAVDHLGRQDEAAQGHTVGVQPLEAVQLPVRGGACARVVREGGAGAAQVHEDGNVPELGGGAARPFQRHPPLGGVVAQALEKPAHHAQVALARGRVELSHVVQPDEEPGRLERLVGEGLGGLAHAAHGDDVLDVLERLHHGDPHVVVAQDLVAPVEWHRRRVFWGRGAIFYQRTSEEFFKNTSPGTSTVPGKADALGGGAALAEQRARERVVVILVRIGRVANLGGDLVRVVPEALEVEGRAHVHRFAKLDGLQGHANGQLGFIKLRHAWNLVVQLADALQRLVQVRVVRLAELALALEAKAAQQLFLALGAAFGARAVRDRDLFPRRDVAHRDEQLALQVVPPEVPGVGPARVVGPADQREQATPLGVVVVAERQAVGACDPAGGWGVVPRVGEAVEQVARGARRHGRHVIVPQRLAVPLGLGLRSVNRVLVGDARKGALAGELVALLEALHRHEPRAAPVVLPRGDALRDAHAGAAGPLVRRPRRLLALAAAVVHEAALAAVAARGVRAALAFAHACLWRGALHRGSSSIGAHKKGVFLKVGSITSGRPGERLGKGKVRRSDAAQPEPPGCGAAGRAAQGAGEAHYAYRSTGEWKKVAAAHRRHIKSGDQGGVDQQLGAPRVRPRRGLGRIAGDRHAYGVQLGS